MRALLLGAIALTCASSTSGCGRGPHPLVGRRTTDSLGRSVAVTSQPRRLISLAPSTTEILFALGVGRRVVGRDRYSDFPEESKAAPSVGADIDPSIERILALRPDLVFTATSANQQSTVETLERLGIPVYVSRIERLEDLYTDIEKIARALDLEDRGKALAASTQTRLAEVHRKIATLPPTRMLLVVWPDPLVVAGSTSHLSGVISIAGGLNLAADSPQPFPTYSLERVQARAPDVLVVSTHGDDSVLPPLESLRRLRSVPAVKNDRIATIDGNLLFRPGPRIAEGAEALARLLHPEAFE